MPCFTTCADLYGIPAVGSSSLVAVDDGNAGVPSSADRLGIRDRLLLAIARRGPPAPFAQEADLFARGVREFFIGATGQRGENSR